MTYSPNHIRGQWSAHGRYLSRESANSEGVGFTASTNAAIIPETLGAWQKAGDPRLFKMIVSPEFGERLDLKQHTRQLMKRLSQELGAELEWVAVAHFNTGHPHLHVAIRGVTTLGQLRLPRNVIKHSIRRHAEDLCTEQLGFRTVNDAIESERREVAALNITSLDREIQRRMSLTSGAFAKMELEPTEGPDRRALHTHHLAARLHFLAKLGLAESQTQNRWLVSQDFHSKLRGLQLENDRQRSIFDKSPKPNQARTSRQL
ncbi:relaxase/mobilization nuclease domain-containing protein [Bryobacter aggregatus]|uniref:relaxase/mobilization nuclease domain-containing protein n=1 Tax=Bryobacter aggregatus TaxID=360054 RepID=UPI0012BAF257|nr:hypothetical protein [Bryobacter aggregatus]